MAVKYTTANGQTITVSENMAQQMAANASRGGNTGTVSGGILTVNPTQQSPTQPSVASTQTQTASPSYTPMPTATPTPTPTAMPTQGASPTYTPVTQQEPWQVQLESYKNDNQAGLTEIARAGQVYNQKMATGDTAGAQQAHVWANQIRNAMGMQAGVTHDPVSGASLQPQQPEQPEVLPWWQKEKFEQPVLQQENPYQGQMQNILGQLQQQVNQPFSYDPQSDPAYQSMVDNASRTVMEQMNQRGILASTVTRDSVAQAISPIISQLMEFAYNRQQGQVNNLMNLLGQTNTLENQQYQRTQETENLAYERQRQEYLDQAAKASAELEAKKQEIKDALDKVKTLGFVDNYASVVLGVPVGTPSFEAQKFAQEQLVKIEIEKSRLDVEMQKAQLSAQTSRANNASSNAASMARTQYTQGQISARDTSMSSKDIENLALQKAKADPRLAGTETDYAGKVLNPADGVNYFTLAQLVDAYKQEYYGGQGGFSDEDISQFLE